MKKLLILGGSHRDIPLIKAAQELGYYVITLANRDEYLGHQYSDKYYKIDFNNQTEVQRIMKEERIKHIIPGCGEESYLQTVTIAHKFKIGNYDKLNTAKLLHNKWKFKEFCLAHHISTPKGHFYKDNSDIETLAFPIVVKPTNLSGGRGVEVVKNKLELTRALIKTKQFSSEVFLEEFIDGELIAYSIFLINQKIVYGFLGKDDSYLNKYLITSAYPTTLEEETLTKLQNDIEKLSGLLSLVDGMFHLQVLIKNSVPYIIDVTRRIPGDLYPYLIEFCDKVKYTRAVVNSYLSTKIENEFIPQGTQDFVIRHCVMPSKNGIYDSLYIDPILKNKIIYKLDLINEKSHIEKFLATQIAIIFIQITKDHINIIKNINNLIYPIVK